MAHLLTILIPLVRHHVDQEQAPATCKTDTDCPSGMKCVQVPARAQPTTAAKSTVPRGLAPVGKATAAPTQRSATPSAANTTGPQRMRKPRMIGQCRVPPPK